MKNHDVQSNENSESLKDQFQDVKKQLRKPMTTKDYLQTLIGLMVAIILIYNFNQEKEYDVSDLEGTWQINYEVTARVLVQEAQYKEIKNYRDSTVDSSLQAQMEFQDIQKKSYEKAFKATVKAMKDGLGEFNIKITPSTIVSLSNSIIFPQEPLSYTVDSQKDSSFFIVTEENKKIKLTITSSGLLYMKSDLMEYGVYFDKKSLFF